MTSLISVSSVSSVVNSIVTTIEKEILPRLQGEQTFGAVAAHKKCQLLSSPPLRKQPDAAPHLHKPPPLVNGWQRSDALVLAYVQRGEADFYIGRCRASCPAGSFVLLFPPAWRSLVSGAHCFGATSQQGQSHILWLTFKPGVIECHSCRVQGEAVHETNALFIPESHLHRLLPLLGSALDEPSASENIRQLLWLFFDRVGRKLREDSFLMTRPTQQNPEDGDLAQSIGEKALRYVEANLREKLTLESVARAIFSTRTRVARDFKAHTGMPLGTYLQHRRLEQSRLLLATTTDSIATIARQSGFSDADYFCAAFRKSAGMTPSQYRQQATMNTKR